MEDVDLSIPASSFAEEDLDEAMFGMTTRHRPEELDSLERSTKVGFAQCVEKTEEKASFIYRSFQFTRKEIQLIYRGFKQVMMII